MGTTSAGRGLFEMLIAELEYDMALLPDGQERDELSTALVGLHKKLDSIDLQR